MKNRKGQDFIRVQPNEERKTRNAPVITVLMTGICKTKKKEFETHQWEEISYN